MIVPCSIVPSACIEPFFQQTLDYRGPCIVRFLRNMTLYPSDAGQQKIGHILKRHRILYHAPAATAH